MQLKPVPLDATDQAVAWTPLPHYHRGMTKALKRAFDAASQLPEKDQDALAAAILEELAADERWEAALAAAPAVLERLADEALGEHRAGRTKPLDLDRR